MAGAARSVAAICLLKLCAIGKASPMRTHPGLGGGGGPGGGVGTIDSALTVTPCFPFASVRIRSPLHKDGFALPGDLMASEAIDPGSTPGTRTIREMPKCHRYCRNH